MPFATHPQPGDDKRDGIRRGCLIMSVFVAEKWAVDVFSTFECIEFL